MKDPYWITLREAVSIHDEQIAVFGGSSGIRDHGLLESALARPRNIFVYDVKNASVSRLAAAYGFALSSNHPFIDGNKRTALVVVYAFLNRNGVSLNANELDAYHVFLDLAAGRMQETELTRWLEMNTSVTPRNPKRK